MKYRKISYKTLLGTFADVAVYVAVLFSIVCIVIAAGVGVIRWTEFVWKNMEF